MTDGEVRQKFQKLRRFKRSKGVLRFDSEHCQAFIFGAPGESLWAWAVYGAHYAREGVEFSLKRARQKANHYIGECLRIAAAVKEEKP